MTPEQIKDYNLRRKNLKDMYCTKCNKIYKKALNNKCLLCHKQLIEYNENIPKCPTCQSTDIKKIGALDRVTSVAFLGLASSKIGKQFQCNNCGYKW